MWYWRSLFARPSLLLWHPDYVFPATILIGVALVVVAVVWL